MGYFLFVGLLAVVTVVAFFFAPGLYKIAAIAGAALLFVGVTIVASTDTVDNGHVGIKKQFGALVGEPTGQGLVSHAPWQSIDQVSIQNEKRTYKMGDQGINTGNIQVDVTGGSAVSRDSQAISLFVQVNYSLDSGKVVELYKQTGGNFLPRILDNAVFQHAKSMTAAFAATEFAANREKVRQSIEKSLAAEVGPKGIRIQNVSLLDVGYSPGLAAAIEKTVEANQRAKAAEAQVAVSEAQAKQRVAEANGIASSLLVNARATSKAQKLRQKTLTPLLVQEEAIKTLNPDVQVIVCAAGKVCIPQAVIATADAATK
jgi:regulator of protease activity HflC (stomatin/prohibitin superfamily)